jgi:hypothetical protein
MGKKGKSKREKKDKKKGMVEKKDSTAKSKGSALLNFLKKNKKTKAEKIIVANNNMF